MACKHLLGLALTANIKFIFANKAVTSNKCSNLYRVNFDTNEPDISIQEIYAEKKEFAHHNYKEYMGRKEEADEELYGQVAESFSRSDKLKSPSTASEWILEAMTDCALFVGDEARIGGLLKNALTHTEHAQPLLQSVVKLLRRSGNHALAAAKRLADSAPLNETWARELRESDYAVLNAHSLVAIWGALETCVEDTAVSILMNWPDALVELDAIGVRFDSSQLLANHENAHAIYSKIEKKLNVNGDIVATYSAVLKHFDLTAPVSEETAAVLLEANSLRNCLLHRGGFIDSRAVRNAPLLHGREGEKVRISSVDYLRYHKAISDWTVALLESTVKSKYMGSVHNTDQREHLNRNLRFRPK